MKLDRAVLCCSCVVESPCSPREHASSTCHLAVRTQQMLEQAWSQKCSGLGVWARGMCCTSPFSRSCCGLGTRPALVQSSGLHSPHFLCFFIAPRKHYLGYFCAGDIIVWLYKQTFAWICGSKGRRWDLRGTGWLKGCECSVGTEWKEWASNFRS